MSTLDPAVDDTPSEKELATALAKATDLDETTALDVVVALHGAVEEHDLIWPKYSKDRFARQLRRRLELAYIRRTEE